MKHTYFAWFRNDDMKKPSSRTVCFIQLGYAQQLVKRWLDISFVEEVGITEVVE